MLARCSVVVEKFNVRCLVLVSVVICLSNCFHFDYIYALRLVVAAASQVGLLRDSSFDVRRPDDGHIRTETCSLTHNKI